MQESNSTGTVASDREIVTTRIFDAPRERVFEAWSRAEHLERWWGPNGFTTTTQGFEFRPGGAWRHTMHGPDGTDYPNRLVYDEIVRSERIVYSHHGGIDGVPAQFQQTVTFTARGDKTELTMRMVFRSAAERDAVVQKYGAAEGAKQTLARLGELLKAPVGMRPEFRIKRVFDAPKRMVFEAWSKAEYVTRWFTPAPLTTQGCEVNLTPGGAFRLVMRTPEGIEYPMEAQFVEVVPNERIVFIAQIHDGLEVHTTVTFTEQDGKTLLTAHQIYSKPSAAVDGAPTGWNLTLDQLGVFLRSRG